MEEPYDAVLIVAFGGPERRDDVMPFLQNVVRGRRVPQARLLEVAAHYDHFGGASPHNAQVRELVGALRRELDAHQIDLPIYWGNRNWHPLLTDTMQQMADDGIRRALAVVLAAYSSYSSCRQYQENIADAQAAVGGGAPHVDKIRVFYNHPEFIAANIDRLNEALGRFPAEHPSPHTPLPLGEGLGVRERVHVAYTAHSIPASMARTCDYELQLNETCRLVSEGAGIPPERWKLVYQSRSGRPIDPWLEPDICDYLDDLHRQGVQNVVVMPIGFVSDHMEVVYDLDVESRQRSKQLGLTMVRASTVGTHPRFIAMLRELIEERLKENAPQRAVGRFGPGPNVCPPDCCPHRAS